MYFRNRNFGSWKETPRQLRIFWIIALINCISFFVVSGFVGGYAVAGKIEGGRFFVGYQRQYTEVSKLTFYETWAYAAITAIASFVSLLTIVNRGRDIRK